MVSRVSKIWILWHRPKARATPWICCKTMLSFMIGRTRPQIPARQPRVESQSVWGRYGLLIGVLLCTAAAAQPPPPSSGAQQSPTPGTQPPPGATKSPAQSKPDDDFIEFLGADDVGDAAWWEFLKKAPPRRE